MKNLKTDIVLGTTDNSIILYGTIIGNVHTPYEQHAVSYGALLLSTVR